METAKILDPSKLVEALHFSADDLSVTGKATFLKEPSSRVNGTVKEAEHTLTNSVGGVYSSDMPGDFLRMTFSGFKKGYYVDQYNKRHNLGKVEITYSNLKLHKYNGKSIPGVFTVNTKTNYNHIWMNPWGSIDEFAIKDVDATYRFYDDQGNAMEVAKGSAWIPISSLTRYAREKDKWHIEEVAITGGKLYEVPGGMGHMHSDGYFYSDIEDPHLSNNEFLWHNNYQENLVNYYGSDGGAAIASVNGNEVTLHIRTLEPSVQELYEKYQKISSTAPGGDIGKADLFYYAWNFFVANTDYLNGKTIPLPSNLSTSYHYNVTKAFPLYIPHQQA